MSPKKLVVGAFAVTLLGMCATARAGAPRDGKQFVNLSGARPLPNVFEMLPFFLRKAWTSLVTRSPAAPFVAYDRRAMLTNPSITWIGHSTFLVRMDGVTFLTDPIFSERASPLSFAGPKRLVPPGVPLGDLPPVDFVTISHDHYDHMDLPSIEALAKRGTTFVVGLGMGDLVREVGGKAIELDWWQDTELAGVKIHCVPAQHFSGRTGLSHNEHLWVSWVIEGPTRKFYHAGDTGYFDGFKEIGERLGPIDLAAVPIGAYDPPSVMRFVHMNPEEAIHAAVDLRAQHAIAMHWGTFDLTDEPLDEPPKRFHAAAERIGWNSQQAWTLAVGETRRW
ncbi:MAG TPA: MBL fold metallo-hydrolase [Candidatus Acidoferrales bacterium]|nr:MBL fold metallo-hydrolase [Candidatus Acidoferrales bacterium]